MRWDSATLAFYGLGVAALATSVATVRRRLALSKGKHWSLTGHARIKCDVWGWVLAYHRDEARFIARTTRLKTLVRRRRDGFMRPAALPHALLQSSVCTAETGDVPIPITNAYRAFQYSSHVRRHPQSGRFAQASAGVVD
jgi:glutamate-1-semialdehyde 2,1-aminomutase